MPANLFVASFIGSPAINLLEATVAVNGGVSIAIGDAELPVPDEALKAYPKLRSAAARRSWPACEAKTSTREPSGPDLPTFEAEVELVEALGSESMVYFKIDAFAIREGQHEEVGEVLHERRRDRRRPAEPRRRVPGPHDPAPDGAGAGRCRRRADALLRRRDRCAAPLARSSSL